MRERERERQFFGVLCNHGLVGSIFVEFQNLNPPLDPLTLVVDVKDLSPTSSLYLDWVDFGLEGIESDVSVRLSIDPDFPCLHYRCVEAMIQICTTWQG